MKSFIEVVEEIKDIVSQEHPGKKIFDKDIADVLGITQMNFATMKKRDKIPFNELLDFCALKAISINWLLYGQAPESLIESTNRFYMVRYFHDISASAGGGGDADNERYQSLELSENFIDILGGKNEMKNIEAIKVSGDSMEPTFSYDDIVFINRTKIDLSRGGVFVIRTEHGLFIKRVSKRIDGKIDIISDNKEYSQLTVHPTEIEFIGRVVGKFGSID